MARTISVFTDPYNGLAESIITSNVFDMRDAFDLSVSWFTTGAGISVTTLQISNADVLDSIPEGSWSNFTRFGNASPLPPSQASTLFPALGVRYIRFVRNLSAASITINLNKFVK